VAAARPLRETGRGARVRARALVLGMRFLASKGGVRRIEAVILPDRGPGLKPGLQFDPVINMLTHMKRTTLLLDPGLYAELRRRAAAESRTLTEVIEHALRRGLQAAESLRRGRVRLPSYDLGPFLVEPSQRGWRPGGEEPEP